MFKNNKIKLILLAIILFIVLFIIIVLGGKNYIYSVNIDSDVLSIDDININIDGDVNVIKIVDKNLNNGILFLKLKSINKGRAFIDINYGDFYSSEIFYVHNFGVITKNSYFGKSNNDIIIPIFILLYISTIIITVFKKYKRNVSDNMYQYKNITYIGGMIFLLSLFLNIFVKIFNYGGLSSSIKDIISSVHFFSIIIFPVATIVSLFVIISNIKLLRNEGITWKNMLGIILGLLVIIATIIPDIVNNYLQNVTFIDVHNEKGIALYIHDFFETFIFVCLTYLECILLGTIVLSVKAAKHIPSFDKDYIIILGCMIKKDGSLTPLLKGRVDAAIEFANMQKEKTNKDITFIPSGGKGSDEIISEAEAMKKYLISQGIDNKKIIIEDKSKNTFENIKFSYNLIKEKKNSKIALSTTNYHVFRAGNIAFNQNIKLEGIGSKTKSYFWINAFIREFIATIYSEKKRHIKVLSIIMIITIIMITISYISNIM